MSQFEFFMAIASVVMAFGLGELARFWGDMIQRANRGRVGLVRLGWTIYLTLGGVQYWVGMWAYVDIGFTHFRDVFALVVPGLLYVLACHAPTGEMEDDRDDVDVYFMTNRRVIFAALVAFLAGTVAADAMLLGVEALDTGILLPFGGIALAMLLVARSERQWLHQALVAANLVLSLGTNAYLPLAAMSGSA